jgi:rhodanese-related sulfurtransferase
VLKLKEKGVSNAYALLGGTNGWINAKYPTEGEIKK